MNRGLVDRALKSAQDKSVQIENEVLFELMGPKRSMIIVECLARDRKYATGFVAAIYKKHVFVPEPGILSHFEKRGVIVLEGPESVEKAEEIAIECDCEEVESTDDPNTFIIFCDPRLVPTRRDALANFGSVLSAEVSFIPLSPIEGSEKLKERIQTLRDKLMEVPCVVNVHDNLES